MAESTTATCKIPNRDIDVNHSLAAVPGKGDGVCKNSREPLGVPRGRIGVSIRDSARQSVDSSGGIRQFPVTSVDALDHDPVVSLWDSLLHAGIDPASTSMTAVADEIRGASQTGEPTATPSPAPARSAA